jgi:hypothetical protein
MFGGHWFNRRTGDAYVPDSVLSPRLSAETEVAALSDGPAIEQYLKQQGHDIKEVKRAGTDWQVTLGPRHEGDEKAADKIIQELKRKGVPNVTVYYHGYTWSSVKRQVIAAMLRARRPDLANTVSRWPEAVFGQTRTYLALEQALQSKILRSTAEALRKVMPKQSAIPLGSPPRLSFDVAAPAILTINFRDDLRHDHAVRCMLEPKDPINVTVRVDWTCPEGTKSQTTDMTRTNLDDESLAKKIVELLKVIAKGEPDPSEDHALRG